MERVVAKERNPSGKTLLPENLLAGLQPDGGKRRMLYIETPSLFLSAPYLILAFLDEVIFSFFLNKMG